MSSNEDYLDSLLNSINKVKDDMDREEESARERTSSILASPKITSDDDFLAATGLSDPFEGIVKQKRGAYTDIDFLREFEEELKSGEADRFIRDFETELDEEEASSSPPLAEDTLMDSIEGIVSVAKKQANAAMAEDLSAARQEARADVALEQAANEIILDEEEALRQSVAEAAGDDILPDADAEGEGISILLDENGLPAAPELSGDDGMLNDELLQDDGLGGVVLDEEPEPDLSLGGMDDLGEGSLMDIDPDASLDELVGDDEALADIADMMNADSMGEAIEGAGDELDENTRRSLEGEDTQALEEIKPKGFKGLLQKLKRIIFGEDDEEEEPKEEAKPALSDADLEGLSDEQIEIMKNLAGGGGSEEAAAPAAEDKKGKKGKKKKGKKGEAGEDEEGEEGGKKGKKGKEPKPPKPPKEKKEKKPKEKDNTPPLPKSMIIVPLLLLGTVLAGIIGITGLISYQASVNTAKDYITEGRYVEAYSEMDGLDIKKNDYDLWMKAKILAAVQYELDSYHNFMQLEKYDLALDNLICGLGRVEANYANAQYYEIADKLDALRDEILDALYTQFGVKKSEALEVYSLRRRTEYTHRIYDFLEAAGLPY